MGGPRRAAPLVLAVLVAALLLAPAEPAAPLGATVAAAQQEVDEEAERRRLEEIRRQIREKEKRAEILKGQEDKALGELRATERELRRLRSQLSRLNRRGRRLERDLGAVREDLNRTQLSLEDRRERLAQRLRGLYKMGRSRELAFLLSAESFAQFFTRLDFLSRIARQDRNLLLDIHQKKERITNTQEQLDRTLKQVEENAERKERERRRVATAESQKKTLVTKIRSERESYEAAAAELRRTARRIQALLAELERRRKGSAEPLPPYHGEFSKGRGRLPWPVRGEVVGRFGNETHPKWGTVTFNSGVDIAAPIGTDVRAVAKGRVEHVSSDFGSYGQMLILNHGEGYYTVYAHCSAIHVARGEEVISNQVIARVGDTGSLKGSILHFEVRRGATALDPMNWLQ